MYKVLLFKFRHHLCKGSMRHGLASVRNDLDLPYNMKIYIQIVCISSDSNNQLILKTTRVGFFKRVLSISHTKRLKSKVCCLPSWPTITSPVIPQFFYVQVKRCHFRFPAVHLSTEQSRKKKHRSRSFHVPKEDAGFNSWLCFHVSCQKSNSYSSKYYKA